MKPLGSLSRRSFLKVSATAAGGKRIRTLPIADQLQSA